MRVGRAVLVALLVTGCSSGGSSGGSPGGGSSEAAECAGGAVDCGGSCVDPATDADHCGVGPACTGGRVCAAAQLCVAGACVQACSWDPPRASSSLATQPEGAILRTGWGAGQGPALVPWRSGELTAWVQRSEWNQLFIPTGLGPDDDQFAVEVDLLLPEPASGVAWVALDAFVEPWGSYISEFRGLQLVFTVPAGAAPELDWWVWSDSNGGYARKRTTVVPPFTGTFHKLRLEGRRSTCRFALYIDRPYDRVVQPLDAWAGPCDLRGRYISLSSGAYPRAGASAEAAWFDFVVMGGTGPVCGHP